MSDTKTDPTKFLGSIIGSAVVVKLHNGVEYQGDLQSIDGYMNVVLQSAKESVQERVTKSYGDVFIRGNNGMFSFLLNVQMFKGSFEFLQTS
ncbi:hypothetical protein OY671_002755 [Metschnikowia pulcherrima]|nr:hypothetical protein OY671_002755 [Metschnikowia pulcherrima]